MRQSKGQPDPRSDTEAITNLKQGKQKRRRSEKLNLCLCVIGWLFFEIAFGRANIHQTSGFSQSRFGDLSTLVWEWVNDQTGRDGERPFVFSPMRKGRRVERQPLSQKPPTKATAVIEQRSTEGILPFFPALTQGS